MKTLVPGVETISALKCLRESGPQSFEQLVASSLSVLAGIPFRLCRAGLQPGTDALSAGSVGVEVKRYERKLPIRDLQGALSDAADLSLGLDLWVAVSTVNLGGMGYRKLMALGLRLGVAVLILDTDSAQPLLPAGVPPVAALCATDPDAVLHAVENWRDTKKKKKIDLAAVREDMAAIRALPGFDTFLTKLQKELSETVWPLMVRRQNQRLSLQIRENPSAFFHVPYEQNISVRRNVEGNIDSWFGQAVGPVPGLAAVVGERFDGKTWCVLDWLLGRLETLPIPVFFVSSLLGDGSASLESIILEPITQALGSFGRHAPELLRRVRHQPPERGPWALIVLDGLDEYRLRDPDQHLLWALESRSKASPKEEVMGRSSPSREEALAGFVDEEVRPCAVLCTCRRLFWRALESRIERLAQGRVSVLQIGPYNDTEFAQALAIENRFPDIVAGLPRTVQEMVRRPRYLRLMIDNLPQLDRYDEVTEDLLHWFDAKDQIRRRRPGARDWDEKAYQEVLRDLARRHAEKGRLRLPDVRSALDQVTGNISAALQDLESEGILETMPDGKYRVRPEQLRVGMGLHLLDLLEQAKREGKDLALELRNAMEPIPDSEPKIEWLRWAAIVSLYQYGTPPDVAETLIAAWLRSRNLPREDIKEVQRLSPRLIGPLLLLAPDSWSSLDRNERMQEISRLVIMDNFERAKDLIGEHVRSWMRLVPARGPFFVEDEPDADRRVLSVLADPSLKSLGLRRCGDSGIMWLQGFGLYLESVSSDLMGPEDLLALMAVRHIPMYYFNSFVSSESLIFRRKLAQVSRSWFQEKVKEAAACPGTPYARTIYHFLLAADRSDLLSLADSIKSENGKHKKQRPSGPQKPLAALYRDHNRFINPEFPKPTVQTLEAIRSAWRERFSGVKLSYDLGRQRTEDDSEFERTLPAIAAWAPDLGADLIRQQMYDLPSRLPEGRHLWAYSVEEHAVLAEGEIRNALIEATSKDTQGHDIGMAVGHVLVSLLPAMSSTEVLDAILDHHIGYEWRDLFEVASRLKIGSLQDLVLERIEAEHDPRRLARLYYLLSFVAAGKLSLSTSQIQKIVHSVKYGEGDERIGALAAASEACIANIPVEVILPIATGSDRKTLAPRYAGWILAKKGEAVNRLPVRWRAVAAETHHRFRESFLREVETALGIRKRSRNAASIRNEHQSTWHSEKFPQSLVDGLSETRFRHWVELVLSRERNVRHWSTGLLIPLFRRAIIQGNPLAESLWPLVYPFQRESFGGSTRFLRGYVDEVLCDLQYPKADNQTATHLIHDLVLDCRSDRELLEIALGARYEGQNRIEGVLKSLLSSSEPETRARASRLLGWLQGSQAWLGEIAASDPSIWVQRIAKKALEIRQHEDFSHHWFEVFIRGENREVRWGAGQLFLESIDAGGMIWAHRFLREAEVDVRTYGEAFLLLRSAAQNVKTRIEAWGKTFLGYSVSDLERLWAPWRKEYTDWEDLEQNIAPRNE